MKIQSYSFGSMKVGGKEYSSDLIIYPDETVNPSWWRQIGHRLCIDDLDRSIVVKPDIVIIGTGAYGMMRVEKSTLDYLQKYCSEIIVDRTDRAVKSFNDCLPGQKVVGLFHLTC
jgi:hypothetical protein